MQLPVAKKGALAGVPELVPGHPSLQLGVGVEVPGVLLVALQFRLRPGGDGGSGAVVGVVVAEVVRQFTPGDGLILELGVRGGRAGRARRQQDLLHPDVAEMEVRGHPARRIDVRVVPVLDVAGEAVLEEPGEPAARGGGPTSDRGGRRYRMIDV